MSRYRIVHFPSRNGSYEVQSRFLLFFWRYEATFGYLDRAEEHIKLLQNGGKILKYYD